MNKLIVNCETGESELVALSEQEIAENEAKAAAYLESENSKAAQRAALLERLNMTEEEAKLLFS